MAITAEQLKERSKYMGGSDAAPILGLSRWSTPLQVFMSKVYPNQDDSENRIGGRNEAAYWGTKLEDKVAEAFSEVTGKKVYRVKETLIHPVYDFIRANIDRRVVGEDAILECKTATAYKAKEWEGEEVPMEYILQVMHYLAVTGKEIGYLACLIGGQRFVWKEVRRDEDLIGQIINAEIKFWNEFVLTKEPPMVTGADRDTTLLNRLYPLATPESSIILPADFEQVIARRGELVKEIDGLEEELAEAENKIKAELKDHEAGMAGKYFITWKNQSRSSIDSKLLKEKYPEAFTATSKVGTCRVLRIKINEEAK